MSIFSKPDTIADKMALYYQGDADSKPALSEKELEKLERADFAHSQYFRTRNKPATINALMERFGISKSQAFKDISLAQVVFGSLTVLNKNYEREFNAEWQRKAMRMALDKGDIREFNKGMANLIKILQLDKPDVEQFDKTMLTIPDISLGKWKELLGEELPHDFEEQKEKLRKLNMNDDLFAIDVDVVE